MTASFNNEPPSMFRSFLPDLSTPRFSHMKTQDTHEYSNEFITGGNPPWLHGLYLHWRQLLAEPFIGVTNDGKIRPDLFTLQDEEVPIAAITAAAKAVVSGCDDAQHARLSYHIDSHEWRTWSNPEFLLSDKGIRLDEISEALRDKVLFVLETALSPEGYQKAIGAMRVNGFLGDLVKAPAVMNEFSYNFVLFGNGPSEEKPWGFSFYGHHLCLNAFFYKTQMVLSPWFAGAEPNLIDSGPHMGTRILDVEERLGLQLMQSLSPEQQKRAQTYEKMKDPAMPHGRWNHDDQRHLCGAYRDNRVVPYEGILVSEMSSSQIELVNGIVEQYLLFLPSKSRELRARAIADYFHETYFSWIGGYGDDNEPFYYRLQSPVVILEFDHHSGVFLTNKDPARFHIHTLLRTPNAGDYGMALRPCINRLEQEYVWEGERD